MTPQEIAEHFSFHNENMKLLKIGFNNIKDQLKTLYKKRDKTGDYIFLLDHNNKERISLRETEKSLSCILIGIQVSWAEQSVRRLFYEPNLFTDVQRQYLSNLSLEEKWRSSLRIMFCIVYGIPSVDSCYKNIKIAKQKNILGSQLIKQYLELNKIISDCLSPNFSIRNKVQHGEWKFAFDDSFLFSPNKTSKVNQENIVTIMSRFNLVNAFYQLLVDLGRFKSGNFKIEPTQTPFEYFYPNYLRKIKFEVEKIKNPNLNSYVSTLIEKEIKGNQYRVS